MVPILHWAGLVRWKTLLGRNVGATRRRPRSATAVFVDSEAFPSMMTTFTTMIPQVKLRRMPEMFSKGAPIVTGRFVRTVPTRGTKVSVLDITFTFSPSYIILQGIAFFDRPSGTCRCKTSNFGVKYCLSGPSYLDGDGKQPYHGDRHPPIAGSGYNEDAYESKERQCKTCGKVARCLKKEHLKDVMPGMQ